MRVSLNVSRPFLLTINMMKTQSWMWIWGQNFRQNESNSLGCPWTSGCSFWNSSFLLSSSCWKFSNSSWYLSFSSLGISFSGRGFIERQNTHSNTITHIDTLTHTPIIMNKRNGVRGRHLWNKYGKILRTYSYLNVCMRMCGEENAYQILPRLCKSEQQKWQHIMVICWKKFRHIFKAAECNFSATSNTKHVSKF